MMPGERISEKTFLLFVIAGIAVNATGLFNQVLEPDAALYAGIAKRMAVSNDWLNLYANGGDWLDKPHFPFWMAALSFKIFGISAFAYKLPSFIFWLIGIRYVYLLGLAFFNKEVAKYSVIIYMSAVHVLLANFDVRAEIYLTTLTVGSIYYLYKMQNERRPLYLLLAALFSACAIMTKGIFILVTILSGFIIYWITDNRWQEFVKIKWWLFAILTFIFILPELYSLYVQFDLHPEKIVYGKTNVSGLKFFFWDSQFGRFFNTGPIKGSGDPGFYFHTMLWAFLPWSVLLYIAAVKLVFNREKSNNKKQWIIYGSLLVTFILFTLSRFQLPHYIIIILPHCSMLVAAYLEKAVENPKASRRIIGLQSVLLILTAILLLALVFLCDFGNNILMIFFVLIMTSVSFLIVRQKKIEVILLRSFMLTAILFIFLNLYFYPHLLQYQGGMQAAFWMKENKIHLPVASYKTDSYSLEFYAESNVARISDNDSLNRFVGQGPGIIFIREKNIPLIDKDKFNMKELNHFDFFHVSMLGLDFLNHHTRPEVLEKIMLVSVSKK